MGELTTYKCTECGAGDSDRGTYGSGPMTLICWKCRAGKDAKTYSEAVDMRKGMFPVDKEGAFPWEI